MSDSNRKNISSSSPWESRVVYSRAVRIGNIIEVAGTIAMDDDGSIVGKNNPYEQTKFILAKIEKALKEAGATQQNVIRTRMFVTDISLWEEIGRAHGEFFRDIRPAATMVQVQSLIDPDALVEIEVSAILQ